MKQWKHVEGRLEAAARHDPIHKRSTSSTPSVTHIWYNVLKLVCGTPGCWMQSGNEIPIIWPVCERSAASPACHIRQPPSSSGATKTNAILTPYQTTLGKLNAKKLWQHPTPEVPIHRKEFTMKAGPSNDKNLWSYYANRILCGHCVNAPLFVPGQYRFVPTMPQYCCEILRQILMVLSANFQPWCGLKVQVPPARMSGPCCEEVQPLTRCMNALQLHGFVQKHGSCQQILPPGLTKRRVLTRSVATQFWH